MSDVILLTMMTACFVILLKEDKRLPAVLREGRGGTRAVYGLERPGAHACDHLPALVEVGKAVNGHVG